MTVYKKILVAVDLTDESALVLEKARQIAMQNGAELSLLHVMEPIAVTYNLDITGAYFEALYTEMLRKSRDTLLELGKNAGVAEQRLHTVLGSPAREIRDLARTLGVDLVVVGGHGKHGLGLLLGATSSAVSHGIGCDLLIVRMPAM
jgi:universal stress protein A